MTIRRKIEVTIIYEPHQTKEAVAKVETFKALQYRLTDYGKTEEGKGFYQLKTTRIESE
jgi:hypothetical protein